MTQNEFCAMFERVMRGCMLERYLPFAQRFFELTELMLAYNAHTNLTAITDAEDIIVKHYADSLAAAEYIGGEGTLCDVGCGAGFPSLPLAMVSPKLRVTSLDSTAKKLRFIDEAAAALGITNIETRCGRAEELAAAPIPVRKAPAKHKKGETGGFKCENTVGEYAKRENTVGEFAKRENTVGEFAKRENTAGESAKRENSAAESAKRGEYSGAAAETMREKYDFVCARAVAPLRVLSEYCLPLVRTGGKFFALKGADAAREIDESRAAIAALGGEISAKRETPLTLRGELLEHNVIIIQKNAPTPKIYPRTNAVINKNPL